MKLEQGFIYPGWPIQAAMQAGREPRLGTFSGSEWVSEKPPLQMSTSSLESWTLNYFEVTFSDIRTRNYLEEVTLPIILNIKLEICTWGKLPNLHTSKCLVVDDESDPDVCVHVNSTKI